MWLAKPVYEALPHAYLIAGVACVVAAFNVDAPPWPELLAGAGLVALVLGLALVLRRKGYRASRSRRNFDDAR